MHSEIELLRDPKAPTLYRYINGRDWFMLALKERQFRPRFSDEDFQWAASASRCLWIPMVSFCDIPLDKCGHHRHNYGEHVIGLSKTWGKARGLNPILYLSPESYLAKNISAQIWREITKETLIPEKFGALWQVVPYMKPDKGFQTYKGPAHTSPEYKAFEQEMEWRFVPANWGQLVKSRQLDHAEERALLSNNYVGDTLIFELSDIDILIVNSIDEKSEVAGLHAELSDRIKLWDELPVRV